MDENSAAIEKDAIWQGYVRDGALDLTGNLEQTARAFRLKYGYPALEVRWSGCVFLAGPVGEGPRGEVEDG